ncbi:MAG TPA: DoxX family protein [Candidatus Limnocylindrales bacterium]|nr:DoxX family protein [Candidatus Limnocylindrales bacterium]
MGASDLGLLVLRLAVGLTFAAHGAQKAFGWWGGPGWIGWQNALGRMGFRPTALFGVLSVGAEIVGGCFLALGIVTPLAAAILLAQSVVIIAKVHAPNGFWNKASGIEFPLALATGALAIGLTGPGGLSFDAVKGVTPSDTVRIVLALAGIIAGALALAVPTATPSGSNDKAAHAR